MAVIVTQPSEILVLDEAAFPTEEPRTVVGILTWYADSETQVLIAPCFIPDGQDERIYTHPTIFVQLPRSHTYAGVRILELQTDSAGNFEVAIRVFDRELECAISYASFTRLDGRAINWGKRHELTCQPIPLAQSRLAETKEVQTQMDDTDPDIEVYPARDKVYIAYWARNPTVEAEGSTPEEASERLVAKRLGERK